LHAAITIASTALVQAIGSDTGGVDAFVGARVGKRIGDEVGVWGFSVGAAEGTPVGGAVDDTEVLVLDVVELTDVTVEN
jgi:hypothetical protein